MSIFVTIAFLFLGVCGFLYTMSGIKSTRLELDEIIKRSGLLKNKYTKVEIDDISIVVNNHLNPQFDSFPDFEKENILEELGLSVLYSYSIDGRSYTSTSISIFRTEENKAHLESLVKKEKKYCYVTGKNKNVSFLIKPDLELVEKEKKMRLFKELPKLILSSGFIILGLATMVI